MAVAATIDPKRLEKLGPAERIINTITTYTDHAVHNRLLVALAMIFGLAGFSSHANAKPPTKTTSKATEIVAFDPSVTKLPPSFKGTSITMAYKRFVSLPTKGEFETEAELKARMPPPIDRVVAYRHENDVKVNYDPDTQIVTISVQRSTVRDENTPLNGFCPTSNLETSTYDATNGYGVKFVVEKKLWERFCFRGNWKATDTHLPLQMSIQDAKAKKSSLAVLSIVRVHAPDGQLPEMYGGFTGALHSKATSSDPVELFIFYHTQIVTPIGWFVFDTKTGEILGRFNWDGTTREN